MVFLLLMACSQEKSAPLPEPAPPATATSAVPAAAPRPPPAPPNAPMVKLRGGRFKMGDYGITPNGEHDASLPEHMVTVRAFQIDVFEVTVEDYRTCVEAGVCSPPENVVLPEEQDLKCNYFQPERSKHPIDCVTWYQAQAYCQWVGRQLPTEIMWELAARGLRGRDFPWGNGVPNTYWELGDKADFGHLHLHNCETRHSHTCPVGVTPLGATPEGVHDMAGNVSEWTESVFCKYPSHDCGAQERTIRGGSGDFSGMRGAYTHWSIYRSGRKPDRGIPTRGFRCAKPEP